MSSERAFLEQLAADPGDDVTRLVYADWLDDHGDPRAGFLRAEQELARLAEGDPRADALCAELADRLRSLRWDWLAAAGKRWDVWLTGFPPDKKILIIRAVRSLLGCGLAEAKCIVEVAPVRVVCSCTRGEAEAVRRELNGNGDWPVGVGVRPCEGPTAGATYHIAGVCRVSVRNAPPDSEAAMLAAIRAEYPHVTYFPAPGVSHTYLALAIARRAAELLRPFAEVSWIEDSVPERRAVEIPAASRPGENGPFEVRLVSFDETEKDKLIRAMDAVLGIRVSEARLADHPTIVLRRGVCGAEAERLRRLFAPVGQVEIRDSAIN